MRFCEDRFTPDHNATIGVDFKVKYITLSKDIAPTTTSDESTVQESRRRQLKDQRIKLTIWDTAGQERFRTLTSSYYRGAQGVVIVYDTSKRSTYENVEAVWTRELDTYADMDEMVLMVVGNKVDKVGTRLIQIYFIILIGRGKTSVDGGRKGISKAS